MSVQDEMLHRVHYFDFERKAMLNESGMEGIVYRKRMQKLLEAVQECREIVPKELAIWNDLRDVLLKTLELIGTQEESNLEKACNEYRFFIAKLGKLYLPTVEINKEVERKWRQIIHQMKALSLLEYQRYLFANRVFFDQLALLPSESPEVAAGYLLIEEVYNYSNAHPFHEGFVRSREVLAHASVILEDPTQLDEFQAFADQVEGKPSAQDKTLGYTLKTFGCMVAVGGMIAAISVALLHMPALIVVGLMAMPLGMYFWNKGDAYVEAGKRKGLSENMTLFRRSIKQEYTTEESHHSQEEDRGSTPLLSMVRCQS